MTASTPEMSLIIVMGTRPEAIKMVPIVQAVRESTIFTPIVVSTGQHHRMVLEVLDRADIEPDVVLWAGGAAGGLNDLVASLLRRLDAFCTSSYGTRRGTIDDADGVRSGRLPAGMLVHGDTSSALAAALAAFHLRIPVMHVEAGLRAGRSNRSPFPEELNRRLISEIACLHLAPTISNAQNLITEQVPHEQVFVTGNSGIDALAWAVQLDEPSGDPRLEEIIASDRRLVLVTAHRRENWHAGLKRIGVAVARLARTFPDVDFVAPLHPNPLVREQLGEPLDGIDNVYCTEPLAYWTFARLLQRAHLAITDSGGIQEEAPHLGTPVIVARESTERMEGVDAGCLLLTGADEAVIERASTMLLTDEDRHRAMSLAPNPYGDGAAARRIVQALEHLADASRPAPTPFGPGYDRSAVLAAAGYRAELDVTLFADELALPSAGDSEPGIDLGGISAGVQAAHT